MNDQNKNLILATALSFIVILVWFLLFPPEEVAPVDPNAVTQSETGVAPDMALTPPGTDAPVLIDPEATREVALATAERVTIETDTVLGSISLVGGRIDDLSLRDYRETLDEDSEIVRLFSPVGGPEAFYALYGWAPGGALDFEDVPGANTQWSVESGDTLGIDSPVTLVWDNGAGLIFRRTIAIDEHFLFTVTQSIENTTADAQRVAPYGILVAARPALGPAELLHPA